MVPSVDSAGTKQEVMQALQGLDGMLRVDELVPCKRAKRDEFWFEKAHSFNDVFFQSSVVSRCKHTRSQTHLLYEKDGHSEFQTHDCL